MNEKQLYKVFIAMFAINVGVGLFNAYHDHKDRKLKREEFKRKGITDEKES